MSPDEQWVKALGIDYGTVRIGLAVSDDIGLLAHPLETISGKSSDAPVQTVVSIARDRGIRDIVVGLPLHASGDESTMSLASREFANKLSAELGDGVQIHLVDELMTSRIAKDKLLRAGKKPEEIKAVLDQAAAVEILQDWLNKRADLLPPPISEFEDEQDGW